MKELTEDQIGYGRMLMVLSMARAERAMNKFPQPNCVLNKVAEEAGEVVKVGVHLAEGLYFTWGDLEDECIDTIAMCFRLLIEGDQVHGITSPIARDGDQTLGRAGHLDSGKGKERGKK